MFSTSYNQVGKKKRRKVFIYLSLRPPERRWRHQPVTNLGNELIAATHFFLFPLFFSFFFLFIPEKRACRLGARRDDNDILFQLLLCVGNSTRGRENQKHLSASDSFFPFSPHHLVRISPSSSSTDNQFPPVNFFENFTEINHVTM